MLVKNARNVIKGENQSVLNGKKSAAYKYLLSMSLSLFLVTYIWENVVSV